MSRPSPLSRPIRVLLADDHLLMRKQIRRLLESAATFEVVAEVSDGPTAVAEAERLCPDVVILDSALPCLGGVHAARAIRSTCPKPVLIILSLCDDAAYAQRALLSGANVFLSKNSIDESLLPAISHMVRESHSVVASWERSRSHQASSSLWQNSSRQRGQASRSRRKEIVDRPWASWLWAGWQSLKQAFKH